MSLRKKTRTWGAQEDENEDDKELLVFGYSCKLFRDDEKALYIDEGQHLIPWMGDDKLLIDRYDGRGYLHDLSQYEPNENQKQSWDDDEDRYIETLCEEERYLALKKELSEEEVYHEEELKRLKAALAEEEGTYNQVGFSYEENENGCNGLVSQIEVEDQEQSRESEDSTFVPPSELNIPSGLEVPPSKKVNAIIEKTALFVSTHGTQMEIVIKAKQANNPLFAFLAFDHSLNPYYKNMVQAIKSGKYVPQPVSSHYASREGNEDDSDDDFDSDNDHYLHPSLQSVQSDVNQVLTVPKIAYARTGDDRYSLLVSQLKDKVYPAISESSLPPRSELSTEGSYKTDVGTLKPDSNLPPPPGLVPVTLPLCGQDDVTPGNTAGGEKGSEAVPPPHFLPIIDKMASYVAKNGENFEAMVKSKGADERFDFLHPNHAFYPYYQERRRTYEKELMERNAAALKTNCGDTIAEKEKTGLVSFSIKMKETNDKRNAFTSSGSKDEGGAGTVETTNGTTTDKVDAKPKIDEGVVATAVTGSTAVTTEETSVISNPTFQSRLQSLEARLAEKRIKDKLAAAARERLVQVSREKQLQMERKRKAALFMASLQRGKEDDAGLIGPKLPTAAELEVLVDKETDLPWITPSPAIVSISSFPLNASTTTVTVLQASTRLDDPHSKDSVVEQRGISSPKNHQPLQKMHQRTRTRSRSGSRSRSEYKKRRRSRSRSRSRINKSRKKKRSSRSPSRERRSHRSSPYSSEKGKSRRERTSSKTPPAAYQHIRNSSSSRRCRSVEQSRSDSGEGKSRRTRCGSRSSMRDRKDRRSPHSGSTQRRRDQRPSPASSSSSRGYSRSRSRSRRSEFSRSSRSTTPSPSKNRKRSGTR